MSLIRCADCGSDRVYHYKKVMLRGQPWLIRKDSCRFYIKPGEGNPLLDREEHCLLEFKHDDGPSSELADFLFSLVAVSE